MRAKVLALAAFLLIMSGWAMDWRKRSARGPAPIHSESMMVEVVPAGSAPRVLLFSSSPSLDKVLETAGYGTSPANGNSIIEDGTRVKISLGSDNETLAETGSISQGTALALGRKMDINRADFRDLMLLPGVGPVTARRILNDRAARGPVKKIGDLTRIKGIGRETVERLRGLAAAGR